MKVVTLKGAQQRCKKHARQVKVGVRVEVKSARYECRRQEDRRQMKKAQEA